MSQDEQEKTPKEVVEERAPISDGAQPKIEEEPKPLGQESPEMIRDASRLGARRLHRSLPGTGITAFIGGMSVSFGVVAMAWAGSAFGGEITGPSPAHLASALAFPVGFIILLVGKSELFTENFLLPVAAVLERRGSVKQLGKLWGLSLGFNLLGALVFAFLISRPGVLHPEPAGLILNLAGHKVGEGLAAANLGSGLVAAFVKAIFAGWLMTVLTWLMVAAEGFAARLAIIWSLATLIVLGQFNHVVISASEIFTAIFIGESITVADWFIANFIPALLGNIVGGVVFVTMLHYIQALYEHEL